MLQPIDHRFSFLHPKGQRAHNVFAQGCQASMSEGDRRMLFVPPARTPQPCVRVRVPMMDSRPRAWEPRGEDDRSRRRFCHGVGRGPIPDSVIRVALAAAKPTVHALLCGLDSLKFPGLAYYWYWDSLPLDGWMKTTAAAG